MEVDHISKGKRQKAKKQKAKGQKAKGKRQKAKGKRQKATGNRQQATGKGAKPDNQDKDCYVCVERKVTSRGTVGHEQTKTKQ